MNGALVQAAPQVWELLASVSDHAKGVIKHRTAGEDISTCISESTAGGLPIETLSSPMHFLREKAPQLLLFINSNQLFCNWN